MKETLIIILLSVLLISNIYSQLSNEQRKYLLNKFTKRIDFSQFNNSFFPINNLYKREQLTYESKKIN